MRKATKNLVLAAAAAFALSACSDDVTVVEPPPSPPPGGDDPAELSVKSIESTTGENLDPDDLSGNVVVVLNVESGDQQISEIQLTVDETTRTCQSLGGSALLAGDAEGAQQAAEIECVLNTAAAAGECTGEPVAPAFANGEHTLGAQLVLADGGTVSATNEIAVTFNNENRLQVARSGGQGIVNAQNGTRYWGGEDMEFAACPVVFQGDVSVGSITFMGDNGGGTQEVDLGAGAGAAVTDAEAPFVFTAAAEDNDGVEDADGSPHTFTVQSVTSSEGEPITFPGSVDQPELHLDFTGPVLDANEAIQIDGADVVAGTHYSAGDFGISNVVDGGVGFDAASTVFTVVDAASTTDTIAAAAAGVADLPEDDAALDGDANAADAYEAQVSAVADALGNQTAGAITSAEFGVDVTAPELSGEAPGDAGVVLNDGLAQLAAVDPDLASGDPGSGVDAAGITAETDEDTPTSLTVAAAAGDTFTADISVLDDGAYVVTATVPDQATVPNVSETSFDFILDRTAPSVNIVNPPPGTVTTSNSNATFTIAGDASDANGLSSLVATVATEGADLTCGTADDVLLDPDAGEVNQNEVDITESADDFSVDFQIANPGASTVTYCFRVTGQDTAVDRYGEAAPNTGSQGATTDVTWQ